MGWLFERPGSDIANHWLVFVSLVIFAGAVFSAGMMSSRPTMPPFGGKQTADFVRRACTIVGWVAGVGLVFVIMRLLQIDPLTFGRPIWIVLSWIALIAAIGLISWQAAPDRALRAQREQSRPSRGGNRPVRHRI